MLGHLGGNRRGSTTAGFYFQSAHARPSIYRHHI